MWAAPVVLVGSYQEHLARGSAKLSTLALPRMVTMVLMKRSDLPLVQGSMALCGYGATKKSYRYCRR